MKPLPKLKQCVGPECGGCESSQCMAEGGEVAGKDGQTLGDVIGYPGSSKPKPKMMAEGGEAEPMGPAGDMDGDGDDDEMMDACASELMDSIQAKDKKGILDAIRAIVLSCK